MNRTACVLVFLALTASSALADDELWREKPKSEREAPHMTCTVELKK